MSFWERVKIEYQTIKPFLLFYCAVCLAAAIFTVPMDSPITVGSHVQAKAVMDKNLISKTVDVSELLFFGGELFKECVKSYSQVLSLGVEPFLAICVNAAAGLINAMLGLPLDMELSYFSYPWLLITICAIVFIAKILLSFDCTRSFMILTYGEIERACGYLALLAVAVRTIFKISYLCEKNIELLREVCHLRNMNLVVNMIAIGIGMLSAIIAFVTYHLVKTVILGFSIMQLSISFIPFTSLLYEFVRSLLVVGICFFNLLFPMTGFAFNCVLSALCVILFTKTSRSVEYYKAIYLFPLLQFTKNKHRNKVQDGKNLPKEVYSFVSKERKIIKAIPVFLLSSSNINGISLNKYDKWWLTVTDNGIFLYQYSFFNGKIKTIAVCDVDSSLYYQKTFRYLEFFTLDGPVENIIRLFQRPKKQLHFAVSREYLTYFPYFMNEIPSLNYTVTKESLINKEKERRMRNQVVQNGISEGI